MTNYTKGVRLEREVVNIFKANGYQATRTAGSHSPFDVIIWKHGDKNKKVCFVAFVQCKTSLLKSAKDAITEPKCKDYGIDESS